MKPKEFDDLFRQKFEQNDFAYDSRNWDKLAEQMDGRKKKRNLMMWWWMPAAGMAASVALAMGVTTLLRMDNAATKGENTGFAGVHSAKIAQPAQQIVSGAQEAPIAAQLTPAQVIPAPATTGHYSPARNNVHLHTAIAAATRTPGLTALKLHDAANSDDAIKNVIVPAANSIGNTIATPQPFNFAAANDNITALAKKKKKAELLLAEGYNTFKPEEEVASVKKPAKFSIILAGGISHGSQNNGYAAGATIRKMINDKVFIESDVAFASSDNVQKTQYLAPNADAPATSFGAKSGFAAKSSGVEVKEVNKATAAFGPQGTIKTQDVSYSLYYAQVSPSIGVKVMKHLSIGAGPDFQKMLVDNRPATSTVDRGNLQVAPTFDIGFIGKTEYAFTKTVRAGVSYRKGINNVITPTDKYIDRDYLQVQLKCAIFNK